MRSLFAKTLLWFLATTAIAMTGIIITTALTFSASEPRGPIGTLLNLQVEEASQAYQTGGRAGLSAVIAKLQRIAQVQVVFTDAQGTDLLTGQARPDLLRRPDAKPLAVALPVHHAPARHRARGFEPPVLAVSDRPTPQPDLLLPAASASVDYRPGDVAMLRVSPIT